MRPPRSQRGMPIAPLPLPRSRGDVESADKARTFAWRALAVYAVGYVVLALVVLVNVILPAIGTGR
jgi:hypothetical protein